MNRLVTLAVACALVATGCMRDGEWSVQKAIGWKEPPGRVAMPDPKTIPQPSYQAAARVADLGKRIIEQNTFTGIDPLFMTIGLKETVLFHRGSEELVISEGLVQKCATDKELAGVLCAELGPMVAEKRMAKAMGYNVDPAPDTNDNGPLFPGGNASEVGRLANTASQEKTVPRGASRSEQTDAVRVARELLKGAGYDPAELDRVQPLLKQSERGEKLRKQMSNSATEPDWRK